MKPPKRAAAPVIKAAPVVAASAPAAPAPDAYTLARSGLVAATCAMLRANGHVGLAGDLQAMGQHLIEYARANPDAVAETLHRKWMELDPSLKLARLSETRLALTMLGSTARELPSPPAPPAPAPVVLLSSIERVVGGRRAQSYWLAAKRRRNKKRPPA